MRSGARGFLRPYHDSLETRIPVRWYRCVPGALDLPFPTCFEWDQWRDERHVTPIYPGFELAYRYDGGDNLDGLPGSGICGNALQWAAGCSLSDARPRVDPTTGLPICCGPGRAAARAAEAVSGRAIIAREAEEEQEGEAHGATVIIRFNAVATGGEGHAGGALHPSLILARGGEGHGGIDYFPSASLFRGGEGHGAGLLSRLAGQLRGGEGHGGRAVPSLASQLRGGEGHGAGLLSHLAGQVRGGEGHGAGLLSHLAGQLRGGHGAGGASLISYAPFVRVGGEGHGGGSSVPGWSWLQAKSISGVAVNGVVGITTAALTAVPANCLLIAAVSMVGTASGVSLTTSGITWVQMAASGVDPAGNSLTLFYAVPTLNSTPTVLAQWVGSKTASLAVTLVQGYFQAGQIGSYVYSSGSLTSPGALNGPTMPITQVNAGLVWALAFGGVTSSGTGGVAPIHTRAAITGSGSTAGLYLGDVFPVSAPYSLALAPVMTPTAYKYGLGCVVLKGVA